MLTRDNTELADPPATVPSLAEGRSHHWRTVVPSHWRNQQPTGPIALAGDSGDVDAERVVGRRSRRWWRGVPTVVLPREVSAAGGCHRPAL